MIVRKYNHRQISFLSIVVIMFVCAGLFQAKSIALATFSIGLLCLATSPNIHAALVRFRLPVLLVCLYVLYVFLNLALHRNLGDILSAEFLRFDGKFLATLFIFVAATLFFDRSSMSSSFWSATWGILLCSALSFPAMILFGDSKGGLLLGFFTSHNALAGASGSVLLLVCLVHRQIKLSAPHLWPIVLTVGAMSGYLFLMAGSRAFMLGFAAAAAFLIFSSNMAFVKKTFFSLLVGIMLILVVTLSPVAERVSYDYVRADHNILTRLAYWKRATEYISESPFIGVGIGSFNDSALVTEQFIPGVSLRTSSIKYFGEHHAHNIILHLLAEQGLVGLGLLAWFWRSLLVRVPRLRDRIIPEDLENYVLMKRTVKAMFIYLLGASMFGNNLLTMSTAFVFYILAAAYVSSSERKPPRRYVSTTVVAVKTGIVTTI